MVEIADEALSSVPTTRVLRSRVVHVSRAIEDAIAGFGPRESNDPVQAKVYLCMGLEALTQLQSDPALLAGSRPAVALADLQDAISRLVSDALSGCYDAGALRQTASRG
ncbi:MAG: hypothetical protein ABIT36_10480 [Steroidobacteraceae bacterium]